METRPCTHTCPPLTAMQCDVPPYPAPPKTSPCPPLGAPPTDTLQEHAFLRFAALLSVRGFVPNFPSPFLLRLEENPQLRKIAMVKLGSELNDKRPASHMNRAKVLDARWRGKVSVSTISPQI